VRSKNISGTLSRGIGRRVKPRDCTDDRLATVLDYLERRGTLDSRSNANSTKAPDSRSTTCNHAWRAWTARRSAAFVTPEGMFQLGAQEGSIAPICRR